MARLAEWSNNFVHRVETPADHDGTTLVLFHGTGGDENDLIPLCRSIAPRARLVGLRGRSDEEGVLRWFRRRSATAFDQDHIRAEVAAVADFLGRLANDEGWQMERVAFVGYSNGANLIGAGMSLRSDLVRRAVLLRGIAVLDDPPAADLSSSAALVTTGAQDPYGRLAPALVESLSAGGADVTERVLRAGHGLVQEDVDLATDWLRRLPTNRT